MSWELRRELWAGAAYLGITLHVEAMGMSDLVRESKAQKETEFGN